MNDQEENETKKSAADDRVENTDHKIRKNFQSRQRSCLQRETIAEIKKKPAELRTPDEVQALCRHEATRLRKNERSRQRLNEHRAEIIRILNKSDDQRTRSELSFLEVQIHRKVRKNDGDKLRRKRSKFGDLDVLRLPPIPKDKKGVVATTFRLQMERTNHSYELIVPAGYGDNALASTTIPAAITDTDSIVELHEEAFIHQGLEHLVNINSLLEESATPPLLNQISSVAKGVLGSPSSFMVHQQQHQRALAMPPIYPPLLMFHGGMQNIASFQQHQQPPAQQHFSTSGHPYNFVHPSHLHHPSTGHSMPIQQQYCPTIAPYGAAVATTGFYPSFRPMPPFQNCSRPPSWGVASSAFSRATPMFNNYNNTATLLTQEGYTEMVGQISDKPAFLAPPLAELQQPTLMLEGNCNAAAALPIQEEYALVGRQQASDRDAFLVPLAELQPTPMFDSQNTDDHLPIIQEKQASVEQVLDKDTFRVPLLALQPTKILDSQNTGTLLPSNEDDKLMEQDSADEDASVPPLVGLQAAPMLNSGHTDLRSAHGAEHTFVEQQGSDKDAPILSVVGLHQQPLMLNGHNYAHLPTQELVGRGPQELMLNSCANPTLLSATEDERILGEQGPDKDTFLVSLQHHPAPMLFNSHNHATMFPAPEDQTLVGQVSDQDTFLVPFVALQQLPSAVDAEAKEADGIHNIVVGFNKNSGINATEQLQGGASSTTQEEDEHLTVSV